MAKRERNRRRKKPVLTPTQPLVKYGVISFNTIGYGNPTINQHLLMEKGGVLDDILEELYTKNFPPNESDETLSELKYVKAKLKRLKNRETYEECVAIDLDLKRYIDKICNEVGISGVYELIKDLQDQLLNSIVFKTKFHFNRPRPGQLSFYFLNQEELNPLQSCASMSPAYPSGHTLEAYVIADILTHHFPQHKEMFDTIKRRVAISRIITGSHYPSDNDFSRLIAEEIKSNKKMQKLFYDKDWGTLTNESYIDVPQ